MKEKCFDEGTIQAFLDGELTSERLENVARHLSLCTDCAVLLAEAEEESSVAFSALEQEFNTLVPTHRLWTKINDSIEKERHSFWHSIYAFLKNPTMVAFASMLIVFGMFIGYLNLNNENSNNIASVPEVKQKNIVNAVQIPPFDPPSDSAVAGLPSEKEAQDKDIPSPRQTEPSYQIVNANENSNNRQNKTRRNQPDTSPEVTYQPQPAVYTYVSGEESYVKTIATLERTVNNSKDTVLRPSERFAFERDLAVVNDAIEKLQSEVRKNPKNQAAKDVLRASYQNKIDLLNSVTEKNELMASLK